MSFIAQGYCSRIDAVAGMDSSPCIEAQHRITRVERRKKCLTASSYRA